MNLRKAPYICYDLPSQHSVFYGGLCVGVSLCVSGARKPSFCVCRGALGCAGEEPEIVLRGVSWNVAGWGL